MLGRNPYFLHLTAPYFYSRRGVDRETEREDVLSESLEMSNWKVHGLDCIRVRCDTRTYAVSRRNLESHYERFQAFIS